MINDKINFHIFDDVFSKETQDDIENAVYTKISFFWVNTTIGKDHPWKDANVGKQVKEYPYMQHDIIRNYELAPNIELSPVVYALVDKFNKTFNTEFKNIHRAQCNFTWIQPNGPLVSPRHRDSIYDHHVILYYINDSDGETVIEVDGEIKSVSPKKGRMIVFNGNYFHSSTSPEKTNRFVININVTP